MKALMKLMWVACLFIATSAVASKDCDVNGHVGEYCPGNHAWDNLWGQDCLQPDKVARGECNKYFKYHPDHPMSTANRAATLAAMKKGGGAQTATYAPRQQVRFMKVNDMTKGEVKDGVALCLKLSDSDASALSAFCMTVLRGQPTMTEAIPTQRFLNVCGNKKYGAPAWLCRLVADSARGVDKS